MNIASKSESPFSPGDAGRRQWEDEGAGAQGREHPA